MAGDVTDLEWAGLLAGTATQRAGQPLRICELCVERLDVSGAGISMVTMAGNRGVVCATDDVSARIEELQFTLGEGPCVDAVRDGGPVLIPDLADRTGLAVNRWPNFLRGAATEGVRAVFAFPLRIGAISVGAIDLYRSVAGRLDDGQLRSALIAADAAALAVLQLDLAAESAFEDDPDDRSSYQLAVHQATGMVQVQLGVSTEDAFLMLRARAFANGRRLADVATDVVERRLRFSQEDS